MIHQCNECAKGNGHEAIEACRACPDRISKLLRYDKRASEERVQLAHTDGNQIIYGDVEE